MKEFNVTIFRKVLNNPSDESKGFKVEFYTRWRGVKNFKKVFSYLDNKAPDWWYINVYSRPNRENLGRIYTDTRRYQNFL